MTTLEEARQELATALEATGYTSLSHVPTAIQPPCLIVQGGDPYLTLDETTFDGTDFLVTVELFVLSDYQANDQAADDLDTMLTKVLPAVLEADWSVAGAGAPGPYNTTDWLAYGLRVSCSRFVTIDPTTP